MTTIGISFIFSLRLYPSFYHNIKTSQKSKKENLKLCWRTKSNIEGTLSVSFFFFLLSIYLNTWRFSDNFKSQEDFETSLSWCFLLLIILLFFFPLLTSPPLHSCSLEYFFLSFFLLFSSASSVTFASYSYFRFLLRVSFVYLLLSSSPFFLFCVVFSSSSSTSSSSSKFCPKFFLFDFASSSTLASTSSYFLYHSLLHSPYPCCHETISLQTKARESFLLHAACKFVT